MKSTVVDENLSSTKPMYCSREYFKTSRLIQQYEKSTLNITTSKFSSRSSRMTVKPQDKRQKRVTIDEPQSDFYSSDDTSSDSEDDLN